MEFKKRTVNTVKEEEVAEAPVFHRRSKKKIIEDEAVASGLTPERTTFVKDAGVVIGSIPNERIGLGSAIEKTDWIGNVKHHKTSIDKKVLGKITYAEVIEAIRNCRGLITTVSRQLGISVYYVKQIFTKYKTLRQEFDEYREAFLDEVEQALYGKVLRGDTTAMIFTLKCLGKQRGYIEAVVGSQKKASVKMKIVPASAKTIKAAEKKPVSSNVISFKKAEGADG